MLKSVEDLISENLAQSIKIATLEANIYQNAIALIKSHELTQHGGSVEDALYVLSNAS